MMPTSFRVGRKNTITPKTGKKKAGCSLSLSWSFPKRNLLAGRKNKGEYGRLDLFSKENGIEKNQIIAADCVDILRCLPSESIDLVIADPPYYHMMGDFDFVFQSVPEYLGWCAVWVGECYRVLKPTGAFYCWGSSQMIDKLSVSVLDKFAWIKRNLIVWNYGTGRPGKAIYRNEAEFMWFYSKPFHEINHDTIRIPYHAGGEKDKRKNPKGKSCGNVWEFSRIMPNYKESTGHPTQKPEKLAERIILASSMPDALVFIPFAGSGSEIVQCIKQGRNFIATEINVPYVQDIILPRIAATNKIIKQ